MPISLRPVEGIQGLGQMAQPAVSAAVQKDRVLGRGRGIRLPRRLEDVDGPLPITGVEMLPGLDERAIRSPAAREVSTPARDGGEQQNEQPSRAHGSPDERQGPARTTVSAGT